MTTVLEPTQHRTTIQSIALDITRRCQAQCSHCYNASGPSGTAGEMTRADWLDVLGQAAAMNVTRVQFIGGEATLHPDLAALIARALNLQMTVEVFSNLIHIREALWPVLRLYGVSVATSYYSDHADEHERITKHRGSYARTKANIVRAVGYGIPVRGVVVDVFDGQRTTEARAELRALGVTKLRTDRLRGIGRGGAGRDVAEAVSELCGHCTRGRAAVMPNGDVAGCVMSGALMTAGNLRSEPLDKIVGSEAWQSIAATVPAPATACNPDSDSDDCAPAESDACGPSY